jgi:hypothetical protein
MRNFSKLIEQLESKKYFKVSAEIELAFETENEGECGYLADSDLGSVESQVSYNISNIEEISKEEYEELSLTPIDESLSDYINSLDKDMTPSKKLQMAWQNKENIDKYEFYHQMRNLGYDSEVIKTSITNADW